MPTPAVEAALDDPELRSNLADRAVREVAAAIRGKGGLRGIAAQIGFDTINRLRPGFIRRHVYELLPDFAKAVTPHWHEGEAEGDPRTHFIENDAEIAGDILQVADDYVADAVDATAVAVYRRLRGFAPTRIAEEMPRVVDFIESV